MIKKNSKILVVDDNADILFALKLLLKKEFEKIDTVQKPEFLPKILEEETYDVILLDMNFTKDSNSGKEGFFWLKKILEIDPSAVVIFITAYSDVENAVKAIKEGAADFITKPWQNEKLIATISSALKIKHSQHEIKFLKEKQKGIIQMIDNQSESFLGNSPQMKNVFKIIEKVAKTDASVLILGENGTGKELVARALHKNSTRSGEVFISFDLGSITETLFESEMFGHVKGSFTDAKADKAGRIEIANKGTLFLDEIGNLSLPMQSKLLTVLERREVTRVGSNKSIPVDIRLICATNMPIKQMIAENKYREDLLYRINTVEITIPPLRERGDDIKLLSKHFLEKFSKKYKKEITEISSDTFKDFFRYNWPGNIRELQHAIERAVIMTENNILKPEDFNLYSIKKQNPDNECDNNKLNEVEKNIIIKVLKKYRGNISEAAKELGLTRTSLYRRMEKYDI